jgi:hypothetical protein
MTEDNDSMGFVLHLDIDAKTMERAALVSIHFLRLMHGVFPEIDVPFARVSVDGTGAGQSLFCAHRIAEDQRCMQAPGHEGLHSSEWRMR